MDIGGIDILQMLQDLLDNLNSPEFRDAGFCEGLPEEEKNHILSTLEKNLSQDYIGLQDIYWLVSDVFYLKKEALQKRTSTLIFQI